MDREPDFVRIAAAWRAQRNAFCERLIDDVRAAGTFYASIDRDELLIGIKRLMRAWQAALERGDSAPICAFAREVGRQRVAAQVSSDEMMRVANSIRQQVWSILHQVYADGNWNIAVVREIEDWLHDMRSSVVQSYGAALQETAQRLDERERALAQQHLLVRELPTPLVPLPQGVLVLPLVGALDAYRTAQIAETTLEQMAAQQATILVVDVSCAPRAEGLVAARLHQIARAVQVLGGTCVFVGSDGVLMHQLLQLGMTRENVVFQDTLSEGIAYALRHAGMLVQ